MELKRPINADLLTALSGHSIYPITLLELLWPTGTVLAHSGVGQLVWDDRTWLGLGEFGELRADSESLDGVATELTLALRGPVEQLLGDVTPAARGSACEVYFGAVTAPGGTVLVGNPFSIFRGQVRQDNLRYTVEGDTAELTVVVSGGEHIRAGADVVHSNEDQLRQYPGDTLLQRLTHAEKWRSNPIQWPEP